MTQSVVYLQSVVGLHSGPAKGFPVVGGTEWYFNREHPQRSPEPSFNPIVDSTMLKVKKVFARQ